MLGAIRDGFLVLHCREPNRERNILNLVLTRNEQDIDSIHTWYTFGDSDHNLLTWKYTTHVTITREVTERYNYNKGDYNAIRDKMGNINWDELFKGASLEEKWNRLRNILDIVTREHVPKVKSNRKKGKPWVTNNLRREMGRKKKLYKRMKVNPSLEEEFKVLEREVKQRVRRAKGEYELSLAQKTKTDPKLFFGYVRAQYKGKDTVGPLLDPDTGELEEGNAGMAEALNKFFASVYTEENARVPKLAVRVPRELWPRGDFITEHSIITKLKKLKSNKSAGPDGISGILLKEVVNEISKPLHIIFSQSLAEGTIPRDWKEANVIPIFKKGSRQNCGNYRPVSLTSVICKVMESIVRDKLTEHLEKNNLINTTQHGFRPGRSCLTNLLSFFDNVVNQVDQGNNMDVVYLDFRKAFDKVPHRRLMEKLKTMGAGEEIVGWVTQWLTGRTQRVILNGSKSGWRPVTSGVPQGSVLGPLLFLIYINDIDEGLHGVVSKFADDTKLGGIANTEEQGKLLQNDINKLKGWSEKWQMGFNADKCKVIRFGNKNPEWNYNLNGESLEWVEEEKDLGVLVHKSLKNSGQAQEAAKRANRMLGMIFRNFRSRKLDIILPLYTALVRPHLEYGVQFWNPHLKRDIIAIERVQRRATRGIVELRGKPYEERLRVAGLFSLERRRARGDLIQVFKMLRGLDRVKFEDFFEPRNDSRLRGHSVTLKKQKCRLDLKKYFFSNRIVDSWNKLPESVIGASSLTVFKKNLDKWMGENGFV